MGHLFVEIMKKRKQYENEINKIVNSRASEWTLDDLRSVHQQDHITTKDQIALKNEYKTLRALLFISFIV